MLQSTKGIVLRTIKYGDTSIVVAIYTELFGLQSYLVNGVRTDRKTATKANIYQPTTLLDLVVYHSPNKNLQRIKEAKVHALFHHVQRDIIKNTIAVYCCELIHKTITEPEPNPVLFSFFENTFAQIDQQSETLLANRPLRFTLQLANHLGIGIHNHYTSDQPFFDMQNGQFCAREALGGFHYIQGDQALYLSMLAHDDETELPALNQNKRHELLGVCLQYLRLHLPHLVELKSVDVLHAVLS